MLLGSIIIFIIIIKIESSVQGRESENTINPKTPTPHNQPNIIIIILSKQDHKIQLANNKIQKAWLTCWLVVGTSENSRRQKESRLLLLKKIGNAWPGEGD